MVRFALFLLLAACIAGPTAASDATADTSHIRVRILDRLGVRAATVTVQQGALRVHIPEHTAPVATIAAGDSATLSLRSDDVKLRQSGGGLYARALRLDPSDTTTKWTLTHAETRPRTYTGGIRVRPDTSRSDHLVLVNTVRLDRYVASVVASEYPFDDIEGAKAMAVLVRTYALRAAAKFKGAYDHVDHTASQVYRGASAVTDGSRQATEATEGQVVTYNDRLIEAVYFSSSGGHTANPSAVWSAERNHPYLIARNDPYDARSPHHRWTTRIDRSTLLSALSEWKPFAVTGFYLGDRADGRRLTHIDLLDADKTRHAVRSNDFRLHVNRNVPGAELKSTWFDAWRDGDVYVFEGRGFGHGVGLSQWGAHAMAQEGFSYREILTFYYTDVQVQHVDGTPVDATLPPVADEESPDEPRRIGW